MAINTKIPHLMTIRQVAKTGVAPEHAIRCLIKQGIVKPLYSGNRALVNFENICTVINNLTV